MLKFTCIFWVCLQRGLPSPGKRLELAQQAQALHLLWEQLLLDPSHGSCLQVLYLHDPAKSQTSICTQGDCQIAAVMSSWLLAHFIRELHLLMRLCAGLVSKGSWASLSLIRMSAACPQDKLLHQQQWPEQLQPGRGSAQAPHITAQHQLQVRTHPVTESHPNTA